MLCVVVHKEAFWKGVRIAQRNAHTKIVYLPTLRNIEMLQRPLGDPRVAVCVLVFAVFCVGVGGMDPTESACRVLVGIKLKSKKDILLDAS